MSESTSAIWDKEWRKPWFKFPFPLAKPLIYQLFNSIPLREDAKILDVGCGSGSLASRWANRRFNVLGVDISMEAIRRTRSCGINAKFGDVEKLPFEDAKFHLVYSDGLLEHFEDCKKAISEIFRVSSQYVLTMVPRKCLYTRVLAATLKFPTEHRKEDSEWIKLHEPYSDNIQPRHIIGLLALLCEVKK